MSRAASMRVLLLTTTCVLFGAQCATDRPAAEPEGPVNAAVAAYPIHENFGDYWYQGKAEITSYVLEQPRYGETRAGSSVLIFVTENFSREKHVKLDRPDAAGDDGVTVLKLNRTREFTTGIYPYSMMASVFTPISGNQDPRSLKVTVSSQEWCGQTFAQLDLEGNRYHVRHHSYFESDSDRTAYLPGAILEDELWAKIRIDPSSLPTGVISIIAGALNQRLSHGEYIVQEAVATLTPANGNETVYTLEYQDSGRTLAIRFETAFPHRIMGWEETQLRDGNPVTTRATRDSSMLIDYWNRNSLADEALRAELNLQ